MTTNLPRVPSESQLGAINVESPRPHIPTVGTSYYYPSKALPSIKQLDLEKKNCFFVRKGVFMDSIEDNDDVGEEEIVENDTPDPHIEDFREALQLLLGKTFVSLFEALKGLELFKLQGYSPLKRDRDVTSKRMGVTTIFRCTHQACRFRLLLHHPFEAKKDYSFSLGKLGRKEHEHHKLQKPSRATKVVLDVLQECKSKVAAEDGSVGLELQKKTLNAVSDAFGGENVVREEAYLYVERKLKKQKLAFREKGMTETFEVMIHDGQELQKDSCDPALLALLGLLRKAQKKFPELFIDVVFDKHLSYVVFAFPEQRKLLSLYGDVRLFDDKHGVSENAYHLAACTVQTNEGCNCLSGLF